MAAQKQYDLEDVAMVLEHFQNQRNGPPPLAIAKVEAGPSVADKLMAHAPAWLTILAVAIGSYIVLNGRLTTVEYQNQMSMTDRATLHNKADEQSREMSEVKSNFSGMKTDIADIKEAVHDLVNKRR